MQQKQKEAGYDGDILAAARANAASEPAAAVNKLLL